MSKNMIIGQSGGPTAVINSSLAGAIEYAFSSDKIDTVYGMINGIQGLLENNIIDLKERFYGKPYDINRLRLTPAMFLALADISSDDDEKIFAEIIDVLKNIISGIFFISAVTILWILLISFQSIRQVIILISKLSVYLKR